MSKVAINLWYDKEAGEAAKLYEQAFPNTMITSRNVINGTPSGDVEIINMEIMGREFVMMSAGPYFTMNPSISFHIPCKTAEEVDRIWAKLVPGCKVLMEVAEYPFSKRYGWIQDKYGASWQIIMVPPEQKELTLTPVLMFTQTMAGKAEEAANFYANIFQSPQPTIMMRYGKDQAPDQEGTVAYGEFMIDGLRFGIMDSAHEHKFMFNEGISIMVYCSDQAEIDNYWSKMSAVPESEQCGWLKDKYGVSWQIVPADLGQYLSGENAKINTEIFMQMKKIEIDKFD